MKRCYHRKLIRDKIPQIIETNGGQYETRVMKKEEFEKELKKKLLEEAKEFVQASPDKLESELADVLEVMKSLCSHFKIRFNQVEKQQIKKRQKRGGFKKRLFLIWSSQPAGK